MPIQHKKNFGIYHWDTFDNETFFMGEGDTIAECCQVVLDKFGNQIAGHGADRVEIVDKKGQIAAYFNIC